MRNLTSGPQNYTRENILDHMQKFAYFGVAASMALGSDFGDMPFELRDEINAGKHPTAARFVTAGRGIAPLAGNPPTTCGIPPIGSRPRRKRARQCASLHPARLRS